MGERTAVTLGDKIRPNHVHVVISYTSKPGRPVRGLQRFFVPGNSRLTYRKSKTLEKKRKGGDY